MTDIHRIQAQLRESARRNYDTVPVPPFTIFINPDNASPYANYAIPDVPVIGEIDAAIKRLRYAFSAHGRTPRFEFLQDFAPELGPVLDQHGFVEERVPLMLCTPETYHYAPAVSGLTIERAAFDAPLDVWQTILTVGQRAFAGDDAPPTAELEAEQYRQRYRHITTFVARVDGQIVTIGSLTCAYGGLTELAGIGTLEVFRRRGIATAISAYAARHAFDQGLDAVFLTAADERASRVYERAGFRRVGEAISSIAPGTGTDGPRDSSSH